VRVYCSQTASYFSSAIASSAYCHERFKVFIQCLRTSGRRYGHSDAHGSAHENDEILRKGEGAERRKLPYKMKNCFSLHLRKAVHEVGKTDVFIWKSRQYVPVCIVGSIPYKIHRIFFV
jgi:hypothetical protein